MFWVNLSPLFTEIDLNAVTWHSGSPVGLDFRQAMRAIDLLLDDSDFSVHCVAVLRRNLACVNKNFLFMPDKRLAKLGKPTYHHVGVHDFEFGDQNILD